MKISVSKEKSGVDYADTRFSNFAIGYLWENEKFCKTVFACLYGVGWSVEFFFDRIEQVK